MFKFYPAKGPNPSLAVLFDQYKQIFSKTPIAPETLNLQQRPAINVKEVLVEVPIDKQGIPPNKQIRIQKGKNSDFQQSPQKVKLFQTCGLNEDPIKKAWYYKDGNNQPVGPLTNREMDILLAQNKIDSNTRVALDSLEKFVKIEKIQKIVEQNEQKAAEIKHQAPQVPQVPQKQEVKRNHPIMEPFKNSNLTENFDQKVWFYKLSTNNDVIGPLSTWDMDKLWVTMILNEDSKIAFESTNKFVKMEKILNLAQNQLKRLEEEQQRKIAEEKKLQEQKEKDALDIDYSRVPQMEIGEWGEENKASKGQIKVSVVKVTQTNKRDTGKLKSRGGDDSNKKVVNKSMQVEGHYGNLYEKQGLNLNQNKVQKRNDPPQSDQKKRVQLGKIDEEQQQFQEKQSVQQVQPQQTNQVEQAKVEQKEKPKVVEQKQQEKQKVPEKVKEIVAEKVSDKVEQKVQIVKEVEQQKQVGEVQPVEEDQWQEVTVQKASKKKQKNKNVGQAIPGFDPKVQQRGKQKKESQPVVVVVNQAQQQQQQVNNDDDDDGWLEVTGKK